VGGLLAGALHCRFFVCRDAPCGQTSEVKRVRRGLHAGKLRICDGVMGMAAAWVEVLAQGLWKIADKDTELLLTFAEIGVSFTPFPATPRRVPQVPFGSLRAS
jgi:hypothetical protein